MQDPHGRPRGIQYSEGLAVPAALADRLWTGRGYGEALVYAHSLALQADLGVVARLLRMGLVDPSGEAFGRALWRLGARTHCRRCHCEVLAWSERSVFCGQRCRNLWMIAHPKVVTTALPRSRRTPRTPYIDTPSRLLLVAGHGLPASARA